MSDATQGSPPASLTLVKTPPASENAGPGQKLREPDIFFTRAELQTILTVYGRKVVEGEWRDYAIGAFRDVAVFAVHRRSSEQPLFRIEKRPKLRNARCALSMRDGGASSANEKPRCFHRGFLRSGRSL